MKLLLALFAVLSIAQNSFAWAPEPSLTVAEWVAANISIVYKRSDIYKDNRPLEVKTLSFFGNQPYTDLVQSYEITAANAIRPEELWLVLEGKESKNSSILVVIYNPKGYTEPELWRTKELNFKSADAVCYLRNDSDWTCVQPKKGKGADRSVYLGMKAK